LWKNQRDKDSLGLQSFKTTLSPSDFKCFRPYINIVLPLGGQEEGPSYPNSRRNLLETTTKPQAWVIPVNKNKTAAQIVCTNWNQANLFP